MSLSSVTVSASQPSRFVTAGSRVIAARHTVKTAMPAHPTPMRMRFAPVMFAIVRFASWQARASPLPWASISAAVNSAQASAVAPPVPAFQA